MKASVFCLLAGILFLKSAFGEPPERSPESVPNVIIISLSGVRNSESIKDPAHQYFSHLWNDLLKEGMLYTDVVCVEQEFHMTTFNSINTGKSSLLYYKIDRPTIFQYVRKKYGWPANKFWMVGNWQGVWGYCKTDGFQEDTYPNDISLGLDITPDLAQVLSSQERLILDSLRESQKKFSGFNFSNWDAFDALSFKLFKKVVAAYHPKLVHYSFGGPDIAHYDSFGRYVLTLQQDDQMIYEIWRLIQNDPFYKDNTYLFVNADDERNAYYRYHDSNARDNPCHVWLYVFGPNVKKGVTVKRPIHHIDIFPTVARIMEVETPSSDGKVLTEVIPSAAVRN